MSHADVASSFAAMTLEATHEEDKPSVGKKIVQIIVTILMFGGVGFLAYSQFGGGGEVVETTLAPTAAPGLTKHTGAKMSHKRTHKGTETAVATFNADGVTGTITFSQSWASDTLANPVNVSVDLKGLKYMDGKTLDGQSLPFHVHANGVGNETSLNCGAGDTDAGPHYRQAQKATSWNLANNTQGKLLNHMDSKFWFTMKDLNLFGENSIVGRSVVIHKGNDPKAKGHPKWMCATIETISPLPTLLTLKHGVTLDLTDGNIAKPRQQNWYKIVAEDKHTYTFEVQHDDARGTGGRTHKYTLKDAAIVVFKGDRLTKLEESGSVGKAPARINLDNDINGTTYYIMVIGFGNEKGTYGLKVHAAKLVPHTTAATAMNIKVEETDTCNPATHHSVDSICKYLYDGDLTKTNKEEWFTFTTTPSYTYTATVYNLDRGSRQDAVDHIDNYIAIGVDAKQVNGAPCVGQRCVDSPASGRKVTKDDTPAVVTLNSWHAGKAYVRVSQFMSTSGFFSLEVSGTKTTSAPTAAGETHAPTPVPTSRAPTSTPTTAAPTPPTAAPSAAPSATPTASPTHAPTHAPVSKHPTAKGATSHVPTSQAPTHSHSPTVVPTVTPTAAPTTAGPTTAPTTTAPTTTAPTTSAPTTAAPTTATTSAPTTTTGSAAPTAAPTADWCEQIHACCTYDKTTTPATCAITKGAKTDANCNKPVCTALRTTLLADTAATKCPGGIRKQWLADMDPGGNGGCAGGR